MGSTVFTADGAPMHNLMKLLWMSIFVSCLIACQPQDDKRFNGYIDTDLVYLSSDFAGRLVDLGVVKGQRVSPQQYLFRLEQTSENYHLKMSQLTHDNLVAQREQAFIQLRYNEINYRRAVTMRKKNAASQEDVDAAERDLNNQKQQLPIIDAQIKSNLVDSEDQEWRIRRKENQAPTQGIIFDTYYKPGEFIPAGYPVLSFIMRDNVKAIFFVPEKRLREIQLNDEIHIMTDKDEPYATGRIAYVSQIAEFTSPILYSREDRSSLVFRVEAQIVSPDLDKLHLGQPVTLCMMDRKHQHG